ncbi:hypothetical protein lerEdw1_000490 [Lerista edwardsae]|nr:hypothetical protein lerEdw1_000490 [Lerista edwardsae]
MELLVGSPWSGYPNNRMGDLYKCAVNEMGTKCLKMNLQTFASIPNVTEIKKDMNLGLTLVRNSKTGGFLTCAPLWAQQCGSQYYATGLCSEFSPSFQLMRSFSPAVQKCSSAIDVVVVCDESNSIYPWHNVTAFLKKFAQGLDIGPTKTQVGLIQYGNDPRVVFNLNTYQNKEDVVKAMSRTYQNGGIETNTFKAIDFTRLEAFSKKVGGRPAASKVMVVVTDGESHDGSKMQKVIAECNKDNITRFGIASTFQTVQLSASAEIDTHNSNIFVIGDNTLSIPLTVIKPDEKAEVPVGIVIGSVLVGLLLLVALVAALWKLGFFRRKYGKMAEDVEDMDEITELTKD